MLGLELVQSCLGVARVMSNYGYKKKRSVPVIFEPPCTFSSNDETLKSLYKAAKSKLSKYKESVVYIGWPDGVQPWRYCTLYFAIRNHSGFGGLEVACWPLVPKFAGSNPTEAVGFLRVNKNPQHVGGHGCLSVVIVVCCQVEVSATS